MGAAAGTSVDPDDACGLKVGVATASIQETKEIPAKSDACVAAGLAPIDKVVYTRQDDLTAALIAGEVDAMSADSPVTGFAIKLSAASWSRRGGLRYRAIRLAGGKRLAAGGVAAASAGASDADR